MFSTAIESSSTATSVPLYVLSLKCARARGMSSMSSCINICYAMAITLVGNLEVFTKDDKQRGVRTKIAIP